MNVLWGPSFSAVADVWQLHRTVLILSTAAGALLYLPLLLPHLTFTGLLLITLAQSALGGRGGTILDASTVGVVGGESYGDIRLWGAIGYGICSLAGGTSRGRDCRLLILESTARAQPLTLPGGSIGRKRGWQQMNSQCGYVKGGSIIMNGGAEPADFTWMLLAATAIGLLTTGLRCHRPHRHSLPVF